MTRYVLLFLAGLAYLIFGTAYAVVLTVTVSLGLTILIAAIGVRSIAKRRAEVQAMADELLREGGGWDGVPPDPQSGIVPAEALDRKEAEQG